MELALTKHLHAPWKHWPCAHQIAGALRCTPHYMKQLEQNAPISQLLLILRAPHPPAITLPLVLPAGADLTQVQAVCLPWRAQRPALCGGAAGQVTLVPCSPLSLEELSSCWTHW